MKKATLDISPELLVDLFSNEGYERNYTIRANALPDDARIVYCRWIDETGTGGRVRLLVESEAFEDVPEGVEPPHLSPIVSTITGALRDAYERAAQTVEAAESQARLPEIGLHYRVMAAAIRALKSEMENGVMTAEPKGLESCVSRLAQAYSSLAEAESNHAAMVAHMQQAALRANACRTEVDLARAALLACIREAS